MNSRTTVDELMSRPWLGPNPEHAPGPIFAETLLRILFCIIAVLVTVGYAAVIAEAGVPALLLTALTSVMLSVGLLVAPFTAKHYKHG